VVIAMRRARVVLLGGSVLAVACNAILGIDPPNVTNDARLDASFEGVSAPAGNILPNGSFEDGCGPPWEGATAESALARTGSKSCMKCGSVDDSSFFLGIDVPEKLEVGAQYEARAYVRDPGDAGKPAHDIHAEIYVFAAVDGLQNNAAVGQIETVDPLTQEWQLARSQLTVEEDPADGGKSIGLNVTSRLGLTGGCFLVDDVSLVRVK
jgi:hypothetical protein